MWQTIAAIAVPVLGIIVGLLRGGQNGQLIQRIRDYAKVLEMVRGNGRAEVAFNSIIGDQAEELQRRELARLAKKVNTSNLTMAIIIAAITMAGLYGLLTWTMNAWGDPFGWLALVALIVGGLFLLLITAAGFTTIYTPPKAKTAK